MGFGIKGEGWGRMRDEVKTQKGVLRKQEVGRRCKRDGKRDKRDGDE